MLLELDVLTDGLEIRFRAMLEFAVSGRGLGICTSAPYVYDATTPQTMLRETLL